MFIPHSKPCITESDVKCVQAVLASGIVADCDKTREFESAVAQYLGLAGGVATSSGATALFLALKALEIGPGDEVILPTYVCGSVLDVIGWTGAVPVLCDVSDDWCMNQETVQSRVSGQTKAIIVVHMFGIAVDIKPILSLGIPVIEDCAQAFGGELRSQKLGGLGDFCMCSFHATKLLCTGEGGMVLAKDSLGLERLRSFNSDENTKYQNRYHFPMTNIQAALGLSQLGNYEASLRRRRQLADGFFAHLKDLPVRLPESVRNRSIFFRFPIRTNLEFDRIRIAFNAYGVQVRRGVDALLHRQLLLNPSHFPGAERCYAETLSIPLYPALTDAEAKYSVDVCKRILCV
jgi:perosamine synthetase